MFVSQLKALVGAPRPAGAPLPNGLSDPAVDAMTDLFITWLETHL